MKVLSKPESPWPITAKCPRCGTNVELDERDVAHHAPIDNDYPHPRSAPWDSWGCPTCHTDCPIALPKNARFT